MAHIPAELLKKLKLKRNQDQVGEQDDDDEWVIQTVRVITDQGSL